MIGLVMISISCQGEAADQEELRGHFASLYRVSQSRVMLNIERAVCGCDYGGTSWTTRDEAGRVAELLGLGPGKRLLDVGAGAGWPEIHMTGASGCHVTLVAPPEEGLRIAAGRAVADQLRGACWAAVSDGGALPSWRAHSMPSAIRTFCVVSRTSEPF